MKKIRLRRSSVAVIAALTASAVVPAAASAGLEFIFNGQTLTHGTAYATASAHSQVYRVTTESDHTGCPTLASGYSGYTQTPFSGGHTTYVPGGNVGNCGPGINNWGPTPSSTYLHAGGYNPNVSTADYFASGEYDWN